MSTRLFGKHLRHRIGRWNVLLKRLQRLPAGLRGSFSRVYTRCGKSTCWCAHKPQGHPHCRLTWSENGKLITRKVPVEQVQEVLRLTQNYRRFRSLRRQLRAVHNEIVGELDRYEQSLIDRTRSALPFLPPPAKMEAIAPKPRQKGRSARPGKM